jgi:hypothetical protein
MRRARLLFCAELHAMLCAAHGGRIQRRRSALPTIATESTRARCARRYRGVLHATWWAARPLLLRTSDLHEARARAAEERGRALRGVRCWGVGDCGTQGANRHGGHWQALAGCYRAARAAGARILPSPVSAGPGRGARSTTPPAKWQSPPGPAWVPPEVGSPGPPAGSGFHVLPCRALEGALPAGAIQRHGRARLGQPGRWTLLPGSGRSHLAAMAVDFGSLPRHYLK